MRKQTKLAVGLSAAALLAIGASMTSFATTRGWVAEGDDWYYYDNSGETVINKWKSYNGNFFYLGDDGVMLTNQLIEDGDNYYYVDANGVMVKNTWVAIAADEDEVEDVDYRWYYFGSTGKAYKGFPKTINGKKYGFDDDGKMLFGFTDEKGASLNNDEDAILLATYYWGTNDDGARYSGWLRYEDGFDSDIPGIDEEDYPYYWFYFDKGKKLSGRTKKITGKYYNFDATGIMLTEWDAAGNKYYSGTVDDGSLKKDQWVYAKPANADDDDDEEWFRTDSKGNILTNQTKKINGKWYVFDANGIMKTGLVTLWNEDGTPALKVNDEVDFGTKFSLDKISGEEFVGGAYLVGESDYDGRGNLFYFSGSKDDGAMKTGSSIRISLSDEDYTFGFDKSTGAALYGVVNNKVYLNGMLMQADDGYQIVKGGKGSDQNETIVNLHTYLVNNTGTRMKANRYYKDEDDEYFVVKSIDGSKDEDANDKVGYIIYHTDSLQAAKDIVNAEYKNNAYDIALTNDDDDYDILADGSNIGDDIL